MLKRCWVMLLALWPYLALVAADMQVQHDLFSDMDRVWQLWAAGFAVLFVINLICALRRKEKAAKDGMIAKLLLIPFYAISLFFAVILFAAPAVMLLIFLLDALLLLATSAYTLRGIYQLWRAGSLPAGWAILLAVSQLIFVLDVPGSIAIYFIEKRRSH